MIGVAWQRWRESRHVRWIALAVAVLVVDAIVGARLIAWEIELLREMMGER